MNRKLRLILSTVGIAGLVILNLTYAGSASPAKTPHRQARPVVATESGAVRGIQHMRAEQFLGIPYAAPPVRELRFAPPAEPESWQGVRDADELAPACVQFEPTGVREEQAVGEDCLYLDVYRPRGTTRADELPVMVWFHGGGHTQGTGVIYGGSTMATLTDTIVVSVGYRLGALGFLAHPALSEVTPGGSGNYGRMDQLASMEWVRDNITGFGGDPENVTIYGQSAGASAVCDMMAMPTAEGLFHRAVVQSGHCFSSRTTLQDGERVGAAYAEAVGCTDEATVVSCLRRAWPGTLVAHQATVRGGSKTGGQFLPKSFTQAFEDGTWNAVPLMTGTTVSENRLTSTALAGITAQGYEDLVRETYGDRADRVLELYPLTSFKSPYDAITQVQTDSRRACPNHEFAGAVAAATPTFRYEFNDPTSPTLYGFRLPGEDMSNAHSAELAYLFDFTLGERPLTAEQEKLSEQMMRYWGAFAHSGDPNFRGAPRWSLFDGEKVLQLRTGAASQVITSFAADHNCDFWLS